jgi:hypothetical protein
MSGYAQGFASRFLFLVNLTNFIFTQMTNHANDPSNEYRRETVAPDGPQGGEGGTMLEYLRAADIAYPEALRAVSTWFAIIKQFGCTISSALPLHHDFWAQICSGTDRENARARLTQACLLVSKVVSMIDANLVQPPDLRFMRAIDLGDGNEVQETVSEVQGQTSPSVPAQAAPVPAAVEQGVSQHSLPPFHSAPSGAPQLPMSPLAATVVVPSPPSRTGHRDSIVAISAGGIEDNTLSTSTTIYPLSPDSAHHDGPPSSPPLNGLDGITDVIDPQGLSLEAAPSPTPSSDRNARSDLPSGPHDIVPERSSNSSDAQDLAPSSSNSGALAIFFEKTDETKYLDDRLIREIIWGFCDPDSCFQYV